MFQTFNSASDPSTGAPRLADLRTRLAAEGLDGFLVPRADAHQGEYVAPCDDRLAWLTGFTGSAGFAVVLPGVAGVFVDGRYRLQVKVQVDLSVFTPVDWPEVMPGPWIAQNMQDGTIGFDPWLHTSDEIAKLQSALAATGITLRPVANMVDAIWHDRPGPPMGRVFVHPIEFAGETADGKRSRLGAALAAAGARAAVLTLPDSLCWLLNIRGADVPRNPVLQGFAILHDDARVTLFAAPEKFDAPLRAHLGDQVTILAPAQFAQTLGGLKGPVLLDRSSAPLALADLLSAAGVEIIWGDDPCRLPKACKNTTEIAATRAAHLRDGAAVVQFLAWLDHEAPGGGLTEIAVTEALEGFRRATNLLHDISFDTICGAGPNGAVIHYRVTTDTDQPVRLGELLLVDSGAQYQDGTTDITRTIAVGEVGRDERDCYTRVLQGMIAISRARFPNGVAGRDIDALARAPLWQAGLDYDHGTGHGVGAFLSVHEGPQRISRVSEVPLQPGMILSNEPGYYRAGAFGIRLENLIVVQEAPPLGDNRRQLSFETLTFVPFDRRVINRSMLSPGEIDWLNTYHAQVLDKIGPRVEGPVLDWLHKACQPL